MRRRGNVTIDVVAVEAGVSASTVSHVLNGRAKAVRISDPTRQRVLDAAQRLGYTPNHAARSLRRQRTGIVTVLVWRLASALFADIAEGVRTVALRHGFQVSVIDAGAVDVQAEVRALRYLRTGICDGVVVATSSHSQRGPAVDALLELVESGIPVALVFDRSPSPRVPAIDIDNAEGGYLATRHLLTLGHRRIAHLTFADGPLDPVDPRPPASRYRGYLTALAEAGIAPDPCWLIRGGREVEGGREMAHALLERFPARAARPTAVVTVNDRTAIGVLRGFYEVGVRVPDDVALVGFHDIATARYTAPALTTVAHPRMKLGELAAEALFTCLHGGEVVVRDRTVPVRLVVRESCGALPLGAWQRPPVAVSVRPADGRGRLDA
ncbi:MAG: LacI family DNA-binding transcriptional regulator [Chloroflexi bacterium]|nr:LacI family DNA-binding transcriptional regulator [Chloroflexota bacterium]